MASSDDPDMAAVLQPSAPPIVSSGDPDMDAVLKQAAEPAPGWLQTNVERPLGLAGRAIATGVAGLPVLAMDAGVGARNLITGSKYTLPSQMLQDSLDQLGLPRPQGLLENGVGAIETGLAGAAIPAPTAGFGPPESFVAPGSAALTPARQAALSGGQDLGMRVSPGQQAGSRPLQQLEAKLESQPWTSGPAQALKTGNSSVLNRSWASAIGEDSDHIDSTVLARASDRLGAVFNSVRDQTTRSIDPEVTGGIISQIDKDSEGLLPGGASITDNPLVKNLQKFTENGSATGEQLGSLSSKLGKAAAKNMTSPAGDRDLGMALFQVKDHVDDLVAQGLSPEDAAAYNTARQQYRSLMQLTARTGNLNPNTGNVSGANMASYLQTKDKGGFLYGGNQSDAYNATRFAQAFKPAIGDSGTATRELGIRDLASIPLGLPANLLSRAYYKGWLTPEVGLSQLKSLAMGAVPFTGSDNQSK